MLDLEGKTVSGSFQIGDRWIAGELHFHAGETSLHLHDEANFRPDAAADGLVRGLLADRRSVTLVGCLLAPICGTGMNSGRRYYFTDAFVHYVVIGNRHLNASAPCVTRVHLETDDAHRVFNDFDAFGTVYGEGPRALAIDLIKAQTKDLNRPVPLGEHPEVMYFTGKTQIIAFNTVLGELSADHRFQRSMGSVRGFNLTNSVVLSLAPRQPRQFDNILDDVLVLLRFLALVAGREQNLERLYIETTDQDPQVGGPAPPLEVYWSFRPGQDRQSVEPPHAADLPLNPIARADEFEKVAADWIARDAAWLSARTRFHSAWRRGRDFSTDRLISAANMFDLLPDSAAPEKVTLSPELEAAKLEMRQRLKQLPDSYEKQSLLGAIGRLGTSSLKHKVRHRLGLIPGEVVACFPKLQMVLEHAIDCRNFFVHGGKPKLDYHDNGVVTLFTEALEFTFAMSDLVQAGWTPNWRGRAFGQSHPFLLFRQTYPEYLEELQSLQGKTSASAGDGG
ncbi:HEPN domain-containing protein [Caulobacter sp.]|uniref:ApeA N-terminal domain 1-containing protein n=1 Tax=Caulobacter sp. TaxID=78 RepID=UPI0031D60A50